MKLIVGLGNPGKKYQKTRHNIGFMVIDTILENIGVSTHGVKKYKSEVYYKQKDKTLLVKPQTFMNSSGDAVKIIRDQYKVEPQDIYVIHDELDITLGEYKIQKGKGPKDHGGIESINTALGSKDYWRVRIGVENRDPDDKMSGEEYVLQNFLPDEQRVVDGVILKIVKELEDAYKGRNIT